MLQGMKHVELHKIEKILFGKPQALKEQDIKGAGINFKKFRASISKLENEIKKLKQKEADGEQKESEEKLLVKKNQRLKKLKAVLEFETIRAIEADKSYEVIVKNSVLTQTSEMLLEKLIGISEHLDSGTQEQLASLYERRSNDLKQYLAKYTTQEELGKKLFGSYFTLDKPRIDLEVYIHRKFAELNNHYRYFDDTRLNSMEYQAYEKCYKLFLYISEVIENNNHANANADIVAIRSYNMLALFMKEKAVDLNGIDGFIKSYGSQYLNPVNNIFVSDLPIYRNDDGKENYDLKAWRQLIVKVGIIALHNVKSAESIEEKNSGVAPKDIKELKAALIKLEYKRHTENPQLAKLYHSYKISERAYDRSLDLIPQIKAKTTDNIPSVVVDIGAEVDARKKGQYLIKLPPGNMRGLVLGEITDCCQTVGSDGEPCAIDGMTKKNNGFYVLIKAKNKGVGFDPYNIDWDNFEESGHEIVGMGYIWKSKAENLTFDSWENLQAQGNDEIMFKALEKFGEKATAIDPSISRITIGKGGKTPKSIKHMRNAYTEIISEGFLYGDTFEQAEIFVSKRLKEAREELRQKTGIKDQSHIISTKQAALLLSLSDVKLQSLGVGYAGFTNPYTILQCKSKWELQALFYDLLRIKLEQPYKFKKLVSKKALVAYKTSRVTLQDLKDLDVRKIKVLTSDQALVAYEESDKITIQNLKELDPDKIKVLISDLAITAYETNLVTLQDLKDLAVEKIKLLVSYQAVSAYETDMVTFQDLKDLDVGKIGLLVSYQAIVAYDTGKITALNLLAADLIDIKRNILKAYAEHICKEIQDSLGYIDGIISIAKIDLLLSNQALIAYESGKVRVHDLKDLDLTKIKYLISYEAIAVYEAGTVTIQDLKALDIAKIERLLYLGSEHLRDASLKQQLADSNRIIDLLSSTSSTQIQSRFSLIGETPSNYINHYIIVPALQTGPHDQIPDPVINLINGFISRLNLDLWLKKILYHKDFNRFDQIISTYGIQIPSGVLPLDVLRDDRLFNKIIMRHVHPDKNIGNPSSSEDTAFVVELKNKLSKDLDVKKLLYDKAYSLQSTLYELNLLFSASDLTVDSLRLAHEPIVYNIKKVAFDITYLYAAYNRWDRSAMLIGRVIRGGDALYQLYLGEYKEAFKSAVSTAAYISLPYILTLVPPYIGVIANTAMTIYVAYSAINNAYSFYQDITHTEAALKSSIAYKDLTRLLSKSPLQNLYDFAADSKNYELQQMEHEMELTRIALLKEQGKFGQKLYDYIYAPKVEERYYLSNQVSSGIITEAEAKTLQARQHVMVNSNYTNCLEINYEKIENIKSYSHRKTDITGNYFEHYYCYNNASKVLDHVTIAGDITAIEQL
jgi:hypothetical protein